MRSAIPLSSGAVCGEYCMRVGARSHPSDRPEVLIERSAQVLSSSVGAQDIDGNTVALCAP